MDPTKEDIQNTRVLLRTMFQLDWIILYKFSFKKRNLHKPYLYLFWVYFVQLLDNKYLSGRFADVTNIYPYFMTIPSQWSTPTHLTNLGLSRRTVTTT